ncbi:MarR family winged helix-turn-helix transcriptional regulator [Micromonospora maritima]|uniref:MarR family winged helix-turn-helix transcriptional regulator n=1 Tax=Micromonospora maritima TaxID=986711 RepID=UPI0037BADF76
MDTPDRDFVPARLAGLPSWLISQTALRAGRLVSDGLAVVGARGYHFRLLATLDEFGATSQASLGRRSGIHVSDVVAALNELADRDYVTREPDPADRRRNVVTITPAGRRQLRRLEKQLAMAQDDLLAPLTADEREQLSRLLTRVLRHHSA